MRYASGQDPLCESLVHPLSRLVGPDLFLACRQVRLAAAHAIDVQAISEAERLGFSLDRRWAAGCDVIRVQSPLQSTAASGIRESWLFAQQARVVRRTCEEKRACHLATSALSHGNAGRFRHRRARHRR
jgi:hypothetical protein